ncbi:hypothetical protein SSX86_032502 [Deinandra increscens subsp. villosa]|uniref:F-box domain-containing protein n=1 Tax=Deinandra increscens subsp. villosa TaxID=3103831 RepID=A0AAP0C800_9ASTR
MDELPQPLLLEILSRLDDSADVARCRVASKAFDAVFPSIRSINLRCSVAWYYNQSSSRLSNSHRIKTVFLNLISKLETVESVCISIKWPIVSLVDHESTYFYFTDENFTKEWLPMVSGSLKSLSISDYYTERPSNVLPLISQYCNDLVRLRLEYVWLSVHNMNLMPMLTSLTLAFIRLEGQHLNKLDKYFPNLQVLNLVGLEGLKNPKIHILNLKTCHCDVRNDLGSLTLITPNLVTFRFETTRPVALRVEAPMLSHFHLNLYYRQYARVLTLKTFENLKTLWLESLYLGWSLSEFPITTTVENLTLDTRFTSSKNILYLQVTLRKVFKVFPNVTSLCIKLCVWSELEASLNPHGWKSLDGMKGLKTICIYMNLRNPSLTFSNVACLLNQCVGLLEFSLLVYGEVAGDVFRSFMSTCTVCWPSLKWRWGTWRGDGFGGVNVSMMHG